ncbi:hypothetical protein BN1044_02060 [Hafnia alvei]|uniref:Uncharacterized protein n=1 Tax=Hafnia alvei TaxID=569 RepID=A0A1C6Z0A0_HAFAL|nr:hypothetical protein BN1044_02060 [Hafnia alvei]
MRAPAKQAEGRCQAGESGGSDWPPRLGRLYSVYVDFGVLGVRNLHRSHSDRTLLHLIRIRHLIDL